VQTNYLLPFVAHEKIGSQTLKKALAPFEDDAEKLWRVSNKEISQKLDQKIAKLIIEAKDKYNPDEELEKLKKYDVGYITLNDREYPPLLKEIHDYPVVLFIRGNIKSLKMPALAIVGSRKFSNYGQKVAYNLSRACAEAGIAIISGLALGIDASAHRAALDADGITIGVLGCGLDRVYPVSNFQLGKEMIEKGGAIVSEFPIGTPPMKYNFPARNRIIAGLSAGTLVVEAAEQSGALITAYQALEYNREVFAVPGNIDSIQSAGTNKLIQNGAKMVLSPEDIFAELNIEVKKSETKAKEMFPESEDEKKVVVTLSSGKKLVDEIIAETGLNVIAINTSLTTLEMKGVVENLGGGRFKLC
jgi:DNA processing protein